MTKLEEDFIHEYLKNGKNGVRAYLAVSPGVTYDSARTIATKLLKKQELKDEIERITKESLSSKIMDYNTCLEELTKIVLTSSDALKIKAIAEINKMTGNYSQTINVNTSNNNVLENLTETDLRAMLENLGDDDDD